MKGSLHGPVGKGEDQGPSEPKLQDHIPAGELVTSCRSTRSRLSGDSPTPDVFGVDLCAQTTLYVEGVPRPTRGENSDTPDCYAEKGVSFQTDGRGSYSLTLNTDPMSAGSHLS